MDDVELTLTYGERGTSYRSRIVTFKMSTDLLKALDRYARKKRLTRSEVIREAIIRLLKSEGFL